MPSKRDSLVEKTTPKKENLTKMMLISYPRRKAVEMNLRSKTLNHNKSLLERKVASIKLLRAKKLRTTDS